MVQYVESFGTELESRLFGDCQFLKESDIEVFQARVVDEVADIGLVNKRPGCRLSENRIAAGIRSRKPVVGVRCTTAIESNLVDDVGNRAIGPELSSAGY